MPDTEVTFGANTDELIKSVNGVQTAMDGLNGAVNKVADSGGSLGAILVSAFSVAAIEEFSKGIGKIADDLQRVSSIMGTSVPETSLLSGIGKLTGTSLDQVQKVLESINESASTATADKFSKEAQAFKQLGINASELTDTPVTSWMEQVADAVQKLNPSMDRAAIVAQIGGESFKNMIPYLEKGGAEFQRLAGIVKASGAIMTTDQAAAFSSVKEQYTSFELYTAGAANVIYEKLSPAIGGIIEGLIKLTDSFTKSVAAGGPASLMLDAVAAAGRAAATGVASLVSVMEGLALATGAIFSAIADHSKANLDAIAANMRKQGKQIADDWIATLEKIWSTRAPTAITVNKGRTDAEGLDGDARRAARAEQERIQAEIDAARQAFDQTKIIADAKVRLAQMTEMAGTRAVIQAEDDRYAKQIDALTREKAIWNEGSFEFERVQRRIVQAQEQHNTELLRLNSQLALDYKAKWDEVFGGLQSAFNNQLRGLLAGTTTWKQAFKSILGDMLIFFIQMVEKMVFQWLAGKLAMAAADKSAAAAKIATDTAAEAATLPIKVATFTSDITADAARVFAGIFASLAPIMGPAAAGPAEAGSASVLATLAAVPKFELGTDYVPYTGLAIVHEGEKITPASENRANGGKQPITIVAWDGASVNQWLKQGGADLLAMHVGRSMTRQRSTRPKF